jgi:hypothetical protein
MSEKDPTPDRIRNDLAAAHSRFSFEAFSHVVPVGKDLWEEDSGMDFYNLARRINENASGKWSVNVSFPPDFPWGAALLEVSFEQSDDAAAFQATLPAVH